MHKYCSPPQKLGITFFVKINDLGAAGKKTITLKMKLCSMQFKFSICYEIVIEK
jgi:uncharacterized protein YqfB (UPF0267 family)